MPNDRSKLIAAVAVVVGLAAIIVVGYLALFWVFHIGD